METNNNFDFDSTVDRSGTCATKIEEMDERFGRHDLMPFWIADMDFPASPFILDALRRRLDHAVLGYTTPPAEFWNSITGWLRHRHGWEVKQEQLTFMPGLKKALSLCINYFTSPGDSIVIQPPVYHSFRSVIEGNGRVVVPNPLIVGPEGRYKMDFDGLEKVIATHRPKMMIVCNPHNPVGQQWDVLTLRNLVSICRKNDIVLISDEIFGDMMLDGRRHIPTASVSPEAEDITVTLGSPSKTFNIPGIVTAWAVVKSKKLREPFFNWLKASEFNEPPIAAMVATQAAYEHGEPWLDSVLDYLQGNFDFAIDYIEKNIPSVRALRPETSFTLWLDFRALAMRQQDLIDMLVNRAHLALSDGETFGQGGSGFMRMNIAVSRKMLRQGLERLAATLKQLNIADSPVPKFRHIPFVKMHGLGNDFVYVDCLNRQIDNLSDLARTMSSRHTGVGADGIIAILPSNVADCRMRIFNADGSEAQTCGNGLRCVAKYMYDNRLVAETSFTIETLGGINHAIVHPGIDGLAETITVDMGAPITTPSRIPVSFSGESMIEQPVQLEATTVNVTAVSMGNPHGVVFVDDYEGDVVKTLGPQLENHAIWPERANIEFVRIDSQNIITMRAWERGAGETMACASGACAAAAAAVLTGRASWPLTVRLLGGNLSVDLNANTGHIMMTGPAVTVFSGTYYSL